MSRILKNASKSPQRPESASRDFTDVPRFDPLELLAPLSDNEEEIEQEETTFGTSRVYPALDQPSTSMQGQSDFIQSFRNVPRQTPIIPVKSQRGKMSKMSSKTPIYRRTIESDNSDDDINELPGTPAKRQHSPSTPTPSKIGRREGIAATALMGSSIRGENAPDIEPAFPVESAYHEEPTRPETERLFTKTALLTERTQQPAIERALDAHNEIECKVYNLPSNISDQNSWKELERCRRNTPVQGWTHLSVLEAGPCGKGVFAKCDLHKNAIVCDYRGPLITEKEHMKRLHNPKVTEDVKNWVRAYRLEIDIPSRGTHIMEGHRAIYEGSVVIGRFINHTPHRKCVNVKPRFVKIQSETAQENVVLFYATRPIKENEQLLWDYGKYYNDFPWYNLCPNVSCKQRTLDVDEPELLPHAAQQYVPCSQDPLGATVSLSQTTTAMEPVGKLRRYIAMTAVMMHSTVSKMKIIVMPGNDISAVVQAACLHFGHKRNISIPALSVADGTGMLPEIIRKLCIFARDVEKNIALVMMNSISSTNCTVVLMNGTRPGGVPFCMVGWIEDDKKMFAVQFHNPGMLDSTVPDSGKLLSFDVRTAPVEHLDSLSFSGNTTITHVVELMEDKFELL